ncbi:DUF1194 domain-containing protein [Sneathiella chinensis]|uniref:DUF1194 domain-containing protein n=1 Tax=Sneathiella chinensis TaxID=349750 RepID=UPI00146AA6F1|nr:DUF1194 domain-containing protein [Sneathiella chinensis]
MRKIAVWGGALLCSLCVMSAPRAEPVDVQIVLAIDVSSSVNWTEFGLQMRGYAEAFRDQEVHAAIEGGPVGRIAVSMTQWAGSGEQTTVLDWTVIGGPQDAEAFAERIDYLPRSYPFGGTDIAGALRHAAALLGESPHTAPRQVIDVSGDGEVSVGGAVSSARDDVVASGITINGLPILNERADLGRYYSRNVIGGVGAFIEEADDFKDFSRAIASKLAREIKGIWYGV